jgi:hypothetical protein
MLVFKQLLTMFKVHCSIQQYCFVINLSQIYIFRIPQCFAMSDAHLPRFQEGHLFIQQIWPQISIARQKTYSHRFEKNNWIQPRDCQGRPLLEMLWFWGIQVIDFKKLWGSRNHCILCFQGQTTHDDSVTEITFEISISHRKHF